MVYVISKEGLPLMPCKEAKGRKLLRNGVALIKTYEPFTKADKEKEEEFT
jgi:hypothetical protein